MSEPIAEAPVCYRHPDRETYIRCQRCDRPICPDCMLPASVGFQCPSCVKEGSRSVRQPTSAYGGARSLNPQLTSLVLIGMNIAVWLGISADGGGRSALVDRLALIPNWAAGVESLSSGQLVVADGVAHGAWWQVATSMFTHVSALHIATNMIALYFIGPPLEQVLGRTRFLLLYLVSGLGGSAAVMLFSHPNGATVGASGAIFGLLGALAVITWKVGGDYRNVLTWIGLNLVITFTVSSISWQGHVGGLLCGTLIAAAIVYAPKPRRSLVQFGVIGLVAVAAVALIGVRAAALHDAYYPGDTFSQTIGTGD